MNDKHYIHPFSPKRHADRLRAARRRAICTALLLAVYGFCFAVAAQRFIAITN